MSVILLVGFLRERKKKEPNHQAGINSQIQHLSGAGRRGKHDTYRSQHHPAEESGKGTEARYKESRKCRSL